MTGDKETRKVQSETELDFSYADISKNPLGRVDTRENPRSLKLFQYVIVIVFLVLGAKLFTLQVANGQNNLKFAEKNSIRSRILDATRGIILDKNGVWLARNQPSYALAIYPSELPKSKTDREKIYSTLSGLISVSENDIRTVAEKNGLSSLDQVLVKENISHDDSLILEQKTKGLLGVEVAKTPVRQYQPGSGLAQILGYTGLISQSELDSHPTDYYQADRVGKTGLESEYESYLKGTHGVEQMEVDSSGNIAKVLVGGNDNEPVPGDNIVLNIDSGLQQVTATALQNGINTGKTTTGQDVTAGVAAVMDVNTGGILSLVSLPSYDDNLFATKISSADYAKLANDPTLPMFNRAVMGTYPPGSVSKIILASAGLTEGTINQNTSMVTPAAIQIGSYTFPDWKDHSYESTSVERALAESNDIFFYALGGGFQNIPGLGIDKIKKYWQLFGLGEPTGIDLPGEASGLLPDAAWKKKTTGQSWYLGDTYHASIGQGDLLVTPLQMLRDTAVIANGGKLLEPQIVNKIVSPDGTVVKSFGSRIERQDFIPASVIKTVQEGMRMTVTDGSARSIFPNYPIQVAGKTGTAQFLDNQKTHAWFECYAPYDNPQIAIIVMVEGGGEGFDVAAPVAKDIMSYYFNQK